MHRVALFILALLVTAPAALAEVTLPSVFGDHMVLQRDAEVRIWGKADPGEQVNVSFAGQKSQTKANKKGDWSLKLKKLPASAKGQTLAVQGKNKIEIKDVLVGEVWVASGQSNMAWTVANSANPQEEIANSANDQIRMWTAQRTVSETPAADVPGSWQIASPKTTGNFSAVGFYFARKLQKDLGVPVGILHSSWGGTPVEAWTSNEKLKSIEWAKPILQRYDVAVKGYPKAKAKYENELKRWEELRNGPKNTGEKKGYAKPGFDDSKWKTMKLPTTWEKAGIDKDGVVWFRKQIDIPQDWVGKNLKLELGPIDDGDTTYVDGNQVGETKANGNSWQVPRVYNVPGKIVKQTKLTITVRVVDLQGAGGVWGKAEQLKLSLADDNTRSVSLTGDWRYHLEQELNASTRTPRQPRLPFGPEHPHAPSGLYNGMIAPIVPYTIQGAIWYQGESNASRAEQYKKLFPGMIEDWRKRWGQGDFPFLFVQLANYRAATDKVVDTDWAHLRDAQLETLKTVKNTGMAVTIDIGDAKDIHPRNKQDVGTRLARWALADTYKQKQVVKTGPLYLAALPYEAKDGLKGIMVQFETEGNLKVTGEAAPQGFTIAGKDQKFYKAKAELAKNSTGKFRVVQLWSDQVKDPVAVRYAWEDNPDEANLVNEEGLPASPFRTDDWKGPTDGRR